MNIFQDLSVKEIKNILIAHILSDENRRAILQQTIHSAMGTPAKEKTPADLLAEDKIRKIIASIMARRLKKFDKNVSILSKKDLKSLLNCLLDQMEVTSGDQMDSDTRSIVGKVVTPVIESFIEMANSVMVVYQDPYKYYNKYFEVLLEFASEEGVSPVNLLSSDEIVDKITKRMYTKKQYIDLSNATLNQFFDYEVTLKKIVLPLVDTIAKERDLDKDELQELNQLFETNLKPKLKTQMFVAKTICKEYFEKETARLYQ